MPENNNFLHKFPFLFSVKDAIINSDLPIFTAFEKHNVRRIILDKYRKLISNTFIFAVGTFSSKVLVFLLMPLYTNVLSEEQFGMVDLMVQVGNFLLPVVSCGIINGIIRFGLDKYYKKSDVFTTGFLTIFAGFGILLLLEPLLSHIPYLKENTFLIYVFVLMSSLRSLCSQFVRAKGYVKLYALDGILSTATTIFFNVLYLVVLKWGINGYMLAMISADTLSSIFLFYLAGLRHYLRFRHLNLSTAREMLRYSVPLIPNSIFWWINNMASRYLIAWFLGAQANGLFAVAYKIPTIIVLMSNIFMDAWQMSAVSDTSSKRASFFTHVFLCYQALICTAASSLILFSKVITKILVSDAFYPSWRFIPFLLLSTVFSCMSTFLGSVYMVEKKSVLNFITTGIGALVNVALSFFLIQTDLQANGAAVATFVSYLLVFLLRVVDTKRFLPMKFHFSRLVFNSVVLLAQAIIMILEIRGWILFELLLTALMVIANIGSLFATLRRLLAKRLPKPHNA